MKKKLLFILTFFIFKIGFSQSVDSLLLNFNVPDMPAFSALGTNPSNILRPADIKKFAIMIAPYANNGTAIIPKNFALEFAPWKTLSKNLTVEKYNNSCLEQIKYNSAFSMGSKTDSGIYSNKLSLGYRLSITGEEGNIIKSFYKSKRELPNSKLAEIRVKINQATEIHDKIKTLWLSRIVKQTPAFFESNKDKFYLFLQNIDAFLKDTSIDESLKGEIICNIDQLKQILGKDFAFTSTNAMGDKLNDLLQKQYIKEFNESMWNANRFDLAIAIVWQSSDSLIKSAEFSSFNFWSTYSRKTSENTQLLLGGNLLLPRSDDDTTRIQLTGNVRFYYGNKDFRGFLEGQYKYKNYQSYNKSLLFNLGAELRMNNNFWIVASGGINNYFEYDSANKAFSALAASIDLRYAFNK